MLSPARPLRFIADAELRRLVADADIRSTAQDFAGGKPRINPFIGNGTLGACLDAFGGMGDIAGAASNPGTFLSHKLHYTPACFGMEFRVPVCAQTFELEIDGRRVTRDAFTLRDHTQHLDTFTGTLTTRYEVHEGADRVASIELRQHFSQACKGLFIVCAEIDAAPARHVVLRARCAAITEWISHYDHPCKSTVIAGETSAVPTLTINTGPVATALALLAAEPDARGEIAGTALEACFPVAGRRRVELALAVASTHDAWTLAEVIATYRATPPSELRCEHEAWWEAFWRESMLSFACEHPLLRLWLRTQYLLATNESAEKSVPLTPGGLTGSRCWPFIFPQDYWFIYQNHLSLNHARHARATIDFWREHLDAVLVYTRRLLNTEGAYFPWSTAYVDFDSLHKDGVPNVFYYELHNSAYVTRLCHEFFRHHGDRDHLRVSLYPVIREIACLYAGVSTPDPNSGRFEIRFTPNMGQDEAGGHHCANYLCALVSAVYAIRTAQEVATLLGETPDPRWATILARGYAFEKVIRDGVFVCNEQVAAIDGGQKHPVQLNALAYFPLPELYTSEPFRASHRRRYELVGGARRGHWSGWTLGEFLLASVRLRDAAEAERDFRSLVEKPSAAGPLFDDDLIQMYESSGNLRMSYYLTTHGLVCQAITELFVQVYDGVCSVFPVILPSMRRDRPLVFENFATPFGYTISAKLAGGHLEAFVENRFGEQLSLRLPAGFRVVEFTDNCHRSTTDRLVVRGERVEHAIIPDRTYRLVAEQTPGA